MIFHKPLGLFIKAEPTRNELLQEQRLQEFATTRLEVAFRRQATMIINRAVLRAAEGAAQFGQLVDVEKALDGFFLSMSAAYTSQWTTTAETFAADFVEGIDKGAPARLIHTKDQNGIFQASLTQFINQFGAARVTQVEDTTRRQIRGAIEQAVEENLDPRKMSQLIIARAGGIISANRGDMIARTETHTAAQFGQQAAADSTGLNFRKIWVAVDDERTREAHEKAESDSRDTIVKNTQPFSVGGEALMYPGDPAGSAENIINCRCAVARRVIT